MNKPPDIDLSRWQALYYKENYPKLQQVKRRWDPLNIFNHAQSIELPPGADNPVNMSTL